MPIDKRRNSRIQIQRRVKPIDALTLDIVLAFICALSLIIDLQIGFSPNYGQSAI